MTSTILLCTDGSELSERALVAGLHVLAPGARVVVATAIEPFDASMVSGISGFGGGMVTAEQYDERRQVELDAARATLERTVAALGLDGSAETTVVEGDPASALCDLAESLPATVMVAGTHGRGGLKRAMLGSVSDHLVRNAPCPIVITPPA